MVAMTFQRGGSGGGRGCGHGSGAGRGQQRARSHRSRIPRPPNDTKNTGICVPGSSRSATGKSTHTNRNCKWVNNLKNDPEAGYKRARKHRPRGKGGKGKNKDKEEDSSEAMDEDDASPEPKEGTAANKSNPFGKKSVGTFHTFLGTPTVRAKKSALRLLKATVPAVPQYVKWSEKACTFDRSDHPAVIPKECYALVMNRQWMYVDRRFDEFTSGLENFIAVAEANKHGGFMYCPCVDCKNIVNYAHSSTIHGHLLRVGFMPSYYCWTKHGEKGVMMEVNEEEEEEDDSYPMFPEYGDAADNEDNEAEDQEAPDEPVDDDLGRAIADARIECETEKESWSIAGVPVWDEYKQEEFDLRALLFVTINDWPALGNISGQSNKGYNACTHCLDELEGTRRTVRLVRTSTRPAVGCGGAAGLSRASWPTVAPLRYPQSQPTRAHPPRFDYRDPDASSDDDGDYDDYSGEYYRARHDSIVIKFASSAARSGVLYVPRVRRKPPARISA
ncbi:hypothetical protein QYE76_049538 [Lolium multiflorum]|uniref:Transposase-associated domain-containing protein n=1 Tax=Lolium multiflorum TaxID=4521 RepID=A0AAD8SPH9_LOLMU|nr:hypothetical protein QYE76_049538 [Lolium multiflorum]